MIELPIPFQVRIKHEDELHEAYTLLNSVGCVCLVPASVLAQKHTRTLIINGVPDNLQFFATAFALNYPTYNLDQLRNLIDQDRVDVEYLAPLADGTYLLQTLPKIAGMDLKSGLIRVPPNAEAYVYFEADQDNEECRAFYRYNFTEIYQYANPPYWGRCDVPKQELLANCHKILWTRNAENLQELEPTQELKDFKLPKRNVAEIADAALKHVVDRASTYDSPEGERSAAKTAQAFNAITGKDLTEAEVFLILQILKDVRQWQKINYHQDSAEDAIAYAALKAEALERDS